MKSCETFRIGGMLLPALMATLIPTSAEAGIKYWNNQAFKTYDADSYVQDGLVLHYDGIRNAGIDQPHSMTTTTWVNLANPGTHDLSFYAKTSGATANWLDNGYLFNNGTVFREMSSNLVVPGKQTTQVLMDAKSANLSSLGYVWFPGQVGSDNTYWQTWSVSVRDKNTKQIWYNTHAYTTDRPKWNGTEFSYLTALANETYTAAFSGVTEPTSTPGRYPTKTDVVVPSRTIGNWAIGGQPSGSDPLNGSIKSFRFYSNKVLSTDELVWNRAIDDYRFFAKSLPAVPITNAVIASSIAAVSANEPAGTYAVDANGYTFTAPASTNVNGRIYTCTGYTVDTWDAVNGTWEFAVTHDGSLAMTVATTDRVRITWQWTAGDGIVTRYDTGDYVQDGLVLNYDGIRNVGADQLHSYDTTVWKNLAPNGGWDMTFHANTGTTEPGEWLADGYRFEARSYFTPGTEFLLPSNQTIQVVFYANALDQYALNGSGGYVNEAYIYYNKGAFNKGGSISIRKDANATGNDWIDWSTHGYGGTDDRPCPTTGSHGAPYKYVTAVLADDYAAAFYGTSIPTAATGRYAANASRRTLTSVPQVQTASGPGFGIGGIADPASLMKMKGTVNSFRFYNRVLTDEELVQNRAVDDYRFHGIMPVTNVIVATSHAFLAGNEANGNYEISGSYTFGAPTATQTDLRGFEYTFAGYTLETWDVESQRWGDPATSSASTYVYTVGTSPAKVRLTWRWNCTKALRSIADFGLEDIVPNGLVLHYDGIKNLGAESDDVTNVTNTWSVAWVNLANPGMWTLGRANKTTKAGAWTTDGFAFTNSSSSVGSYFQSMDRDFLFPASYSIQALIDGKVADQCDATCNYLMFNDSTWQKAALAIRTNKDYNYAFYYVCDTAFGSNTRPMIRRDSKEYTYGTVIVSGNSAMMFDGMELPTASPGLVTRATVATAQTVSRIKLGGGQGVTQDFTGTIKNFRIYDRVLTTDELVRNRNVDSVRYFGALATTNVFVVAGGEGAVQAEAGAYKVEGEWTFTATKTVNKRGALVDVVRYSTEELVNGEWKNKRTYNGNSYTYTEGTSPATVRLKWLGQPLGTTVVVQ